MALALLLLVGVGFLLYQYGFKSPGGGGGMSGQSIATYAQNAGFSGVDLVTAVAIAFAESGGDPNAYNPETAAGAPQGQGSYGLWQIYLAAHPEFQGQNLYDPQTNANAAYSIYSAAGSSFSPWSTFGSGAYTNFVSQANNQVSQLNTSDTTVSS